MRATTLRIAHLLPALVLCTLAAWAASGCILDKLPDDDAPNYPCTSTADCRGDGFVCVALATGPTFCCRPEPEVCDGRDNDCNGKVDDVPEQKCYSGPAGTAGKGICKEGSRTCDDGKWGECFGEETPSSRENCNGFDDDCDGQTDEDFDFNNSTEHCGKCGNACAPGMWCTDGECTKSVENCSDGKDNDRDGATDCADSDCPGQPCKPSPTAFTCDAQQQCSCHGVVSPPPETTCDDHYDDDCDGAIDCDDSDCQDKSCGVGCVCKDLKRTESSCENFTDDDGDGATDCADPDCDGAACTDGCKCANLKKTEVDCTDGRDNDGDSKRDCVDEDCAGKACTKIGGGAGTCTERSSIGCK
ncbi:MAG TPA: MopE-related protein [Myxococcales bacterium]